MSPASKYCGECGTSLDGDARFCGECGAQVAVLQSNDASQAAQLKKHKTTKPKVQPTQSALMIVPLLSWSIAWALGWLLTGISLAIFYDDPFSVAEFALPGMTSGLIAAAILQRTVGNQQLPGIGTAAVLVGAWTLLGCTVAILIDVFAIFPYPVFFPDLVGIQYLSFNLLFPLAGIVGALLGRKVLKQHTTNTGEVIPASVRVKFLSGWALCGMLPMFTGGSIVALLITIVAISVLVFVSRTKNHTQNL